MLAVALGGGVYIWNADDGSIAQLMELQTPDDYISSVNWVKEGGNILAVGTSTGSVQVLIVKCYIDWLMFNANLNSVSAISWHVQTVAGIIYSYLCSTSSIYIYIYITVSMEISIQV